MNGEYPGCAAITAPTSEVLQDTLSGVSADSLSDPSDDAENSFICDDQGGVAIVICGSRALG